MAHSTKNKNLKTTQYKITTRYMLPAWLLESLTKAERRFIEKEVSSRVQKEMDRQIDLALLYGSRGSAITTSECPSLPEHPLVKILGY